MRTTWHKTADQLPPENMLVVVQMEDWQQGLGRLNANRQWELFGVMASLAGVYAWTNMPEQCAVDV